MYKFIPVLGQSALVLLLSAEQGFAEENKDNVEVIQVLGREDALGNDAYLSEADINKTQSIDLQDMLNAQPEVSVGGGTSAAQKVYVRGIEDTNLNITVDGVPQSGQIFQHQSRLSIDPELLKQVEIKPGTGSAIDGFGSLGGSIRFETKDVDELLDDGEQFGAQFKTGYFSNTDGYKVSSSLYGKLTDNWNGLLVLSKLEGNDFQDGHGEKQANTESEQSIGLIKLSGDLSPNQNIKFIYNQYDDDARRNFSPQFISGPWNEPVKQKSRKKDTSINYNYNPISELIDLSVLVYHSENDFNYNSDSGNYNGEAKIYGTNIKNTTQLQQHEITYGTEYKRDKSHLYSRNAQEDAKVYAFYAQDLWEFYPDWEVGYGLRYDNYKLTDGFNKRLSASGISKNLNLTHSLTSNWNMSAGYAQAMKGPITRQVLNIGDVENAANLKKEQAQSGELAIEYNAESLKARVSLFRTEIKDIVGTVGEPGPMGKKYYDNVGKLVTEGYTISISKQWSDLALGLNYSHVSPELNGRPLNDADFGLGTSTGDTLFIKADYEIADYDLDLGWRARFVRSLDDVPNGYPEKESFNTHDIFADWKPFSDDKFTVNLSINNLFDEFYYEHSTFGYDLNSKEYLGLPEPGRDIRITCGWKI